MYISLSLSLSLSIYIYIYTIWVFVHHADRERFGASGSKPADRGQRRVPIHMYTIHTCVYYIYIYILFAARHNEDASDVSDGKNGSKPGSLSLSLSLSLYIYIYMYTYAD